MRFAQGSCIGSHHHRSMNNSQDSFEFRQLENFTIGIVADGCGSCKKSEVGANFGAFFFVNSLAGLLGPALKSDIQVKTQIDIARQGLIRELMFLKNRYGDKFSDSFLFTILGFVYFAPNNKLWVFNIGDGYFEVNGEVFNIDQFNQPSYIAYECYNRQVGMNVQEFSNVRNFLIATDGISYYKEKGFETSEFYKDYMFENPEALNRHLKKINAPSIKLKDGEISRAGYVLFDDITIISGVSE